MGPEQEAHTQQAAPTDAQEGNPGTPRWSTSPPSGKAHEGTKPPRRGDVDEGALEKSRQALSLAAGEH